MNNIPSNLLTPDSIQKKYLTLNVANDFLNYRLDGKYDWIVPQLWCDSDAAWSAGAVVTLECSLDGTAWSAFPTPVTGYSALGVQNTVYCRGLNYVRFRVSTVGASATVMRVLLVGGVDP